MPYLKKIWYWIRWPLAVLIVFYIVLVLYRIPAVGEQQRTEQAVARIEAQHITLSDVMGYTLPSTPNKEENDATIEGIDKNNNGIRDDVELAILNLHPESAKVRAAELQYAMTQQMFLTDVFNTETWRAVAQQHARAYLCIPDQYVKEVDDLVLNTQIRLDAKDKAYNFTTSYSDLSDPACDIDLSTLPN